MTKADRNYVTHIRTKSAKNADLFCGGGRSNDQTALESVGPAQSAKGTCKRCLRAMKARA